MEKHEKYAGTKEDETEADKEVSKDEKEEEVILVTNQLLNYLAGLPHQIVFPPKKSSWSN